MGLRHDLTLLRLAPPTATTDLTAAPGAQILLENRHQPSAHFAIGGHLRNVYWSNARPDKTPPSPNRRPTPDGYRPWRGSGDRKDSVVAVVGMVLVVVFPVSFFLASSSTPYTSGELAVVDFPVCIGGQEVLVFVEAGTSIRK